MLIRNKSIEKEYIKRISEGDKAAFDALFLLYYPRIKNFVLGFVKNEEDAVDLAQDAFIKIWDAKSKLNEVENLNTYLFQIAKNIVFDFFRRKSLFNKYAQEEGEMRIDKITWLPDDVLEAKELEMLIYGLVDNMPTQRQTIFKMSRSQGLTNDEISEQLKLSKRTVETHISNALKDIRQFLSTIKMILL